MARRGNGSRLRFRQDRNAYYIYFTDAAGNSCQRSTGTDDLKAAELQHAQFGVEAGEVKTKSNGLITELLTSYALAAQENAADPARIGYALIPLIEYCEAYHAHQIDHAFCRAYRQWRKLPTMVPAGKGGKETRERIISDGTVRRELTTLRAAVNLGGFGGAAKFWLPEEPDPRPRWLRRKEAAALLWAARHTRARRHLQLFLVLGLTMGQRKEAILGLKWSQVDLQAGLIDFRSVGMMTTNKRRSHVPVPEKLLGHLRRAKRRSNSEYVVDWSGDRMLDIKRSFGDAVMRAGISPKEVTPHTLRHTAATWLMQKGVAPFSVAGFLGMSLPTLLKVYGHHHPDYFGDVLKALR